jgi:hypothetical protein
MFCIWSYSLGLVHHNFFVWGGAGLNMNVWWDIGKSRGCEAIPYYLWLLSSFKTPSLLAPTQWLPIVQRHICNFPKFPHLQEPCIQSFHKYLVSSVNTILALFRTRIWGSNTFLHFCLSNLRKHGYLDLSFFYFFFPIGR